MQNFEKVLAAVANRCEFAYGCNGAIGFNYLSAKDSLKWENLRVKRYISLVMAIGRVLSLKDSEFDKEYVRQNKMDTNDIANTLIAAFGDGK